MSQLTYDQAMKGLNRALELARAANRPEQQQDTIDDVLDRVFVSPRIVDQTVFEDWSARLRQLLAEMSSHQKTAAGAAADLRGLENQIKDATRTLQQKMDTAIKIVPTIDQRIARAEDAINAAGREVATTLQRLEAVKNRQIEVDQAKLEALVAELATRSIEKLLAERGAALAAQADERVRDATRRFEEAASVLDEQAAKTQARAAQMISKQLAQIDRVRETVITELEQRSNAATQELATAAARSLESFNAAANNASTSLDSLRESSARHIAEATSKIGVRLGEQLRADAKALESLAENAVRSLTTLRDDATGAFTRAAGAIASLTTDAKESLRTTTKAASEKALAEIASLADIREMSIADAAKRAEASVLAARSKAEETTRELEAARARAGQERDEAMSAINADLELVRRQFDLHAAAATTSTNEAARHASVVCRGAIAAAEAASSRALSEIGEAKCMLLGELTVAGENAATKLDQKTAQAAAEVDRAAETASTRLSSFITKAAAQLGEQLRTDAAALAAGAAEAGAKLNAVRDETSQTLTRAASALSSLTAEARETIRTSAEVTAEKTRTMMREFIAGELESIRSASTSCQATLAAAQLQADRATELLEATTSRAGACLAKSESTAKELEGSLARAVADARRSTDILLGALNERVVAASQRFEELASRAQSFDVSTAEHAAVAAESATAKALSSASLLNASLTKAEELRGQVDQSVRELIEMRRQAEYARKILSETVLREAERIDAISEQISKIHKPR